MAGDKDDMDRMKQWIDSFADDVATVQKVAASDKVPREARLHAAGALNYLVTRMDIIPDWEETCGILDDAMVLRVSLSMAVDKDVGDLDGETMRSVGKLANDAESVHAFLGDDLWPRFKKYVEGLTGHTVRGRAPGTVIDDDKARRDLWNEITDELKAHPPSPLTDPEGTARTIRSYFKQKLK